MIPRNRMKNLLNCPLGLMKTIADVFLISFSFCAASAYSNSFFKCARIACSVKRSFLFMGDLQSNLSYSIAREKGGRFVLRNNFGDLRFTSYFGCQTDRFNAVSTVGTCVDPYQEVCCHGYGIRIVVKTPVDEKNSHFTAKS